MIQNTFTARTLKECLELASQKLNIEKDKLKYEIIEQKKGIFKKKVTILVKESELIKEDEEIEYTEIEENNNTEIKPKEGIDGTIQIKDGNIVIKNPNEEGRTATIRPNNKVRVLVDGVEIMSKKEVCENNVVEVFFEENTAQRVMNVRITPDCMEAYVTIKYIPENVYELKDSEEQTDLEIKPILKEQKYPTPYTIDEIKENLLSEGIRVGVIKENLDELTQMKDMEEILIAKGIEVTNAIDDEIHIEFDTNDGKRFQEDENGNVDYKSIGRIKEVKEGQILAIREIGNEGKDGIDVKGSVKKHTPRKEVHLKIGQGCEFKDENTVVSTIEGKPSLKGGIICVNKVHRIEKDVDITIGNVDFVGDVVIYGNVREGMEVNCGQNLIVNKNVEHAKLHSKQDMDVLGNVINSKLYAGGESILKLNKLNILQKLNEGTSELISTVDHIKKFNLLGKKVRDGEIVKVLLENKFKYINDLCTNFIEIITEDDSDKEKFLSGCINRNLIGVGPLNIKDTEELHAIVFKINKAISAINNTQSIPVTMNISYCQDSTLKCSGDVVITGKGEYISEINSHGSVQFVSTGSIARGGVIKAENEIKCKEVGSEGGVSTKLVVGSKGHIWVDVAYQNTRFIVGEKEYILETPSKDIHAYLAEDGELTVDKFVL